MTDRTADLIAELRGTVCRCGLRKLSRQTFCTGCFYSLPSDQRMAIYRRIGQGYEEAYDAACALLDVDAIEDEEARA